MTAMSVASGALVERDRELAQIDGVVHRLRESVAGERDPGTDAQRAMFHLAGARRRVDSLWFANPRHQFQPPARWLLFAQTTFRNRENGYQRTGFHR
jgi:hypothetical protein